MTHPPRIYLTGNTYPHREAIKAAGGRWDATRKQWYIHPSAAPAMRALAQKARSQKRATSHQTPDDQKIIGDATILKGIHGSGTATRAFIAWMGRLPSTGHLTAKLITLDGKRSFWISGKDLRVERRFEKPLPLAGLLAQLENA